MAGKIKSVRGIKSYRATLFFLAADETPTLQVVKGSGLICRHSLITKKTSTMAGKIVSFPAVRRIREAGFGLDSDFQN